MVDGAEVDAVEDTCDGPPSGRCALAPPPAGCQRTFAGAYAAGATLELREQGARSVAHLRRVRLHRFGAPDADADTTGSGN